VLEDLGAADTQAYGTAKSRVQALLTAYERRGSLSDAETQQLGDGLELMNEYQNNQANTSGAVNPLPCSAPRI